MKPGPHSRTEGAAATGSVLDLEYWHRVQSRFSEIIGANLHFVLPSEFFSCLSTHITPSCSDMALVAKSLLPQKTNCVWQAYQFSLIQSENFFTCIHKLHYSTMAVRVRRRLVGTLAIGPVLLGKRESGEVYKQMCGDLLLDLDHFLDRVHELPSFSFNSIRNILICLKEIAEYSIRSAVHSETVA